MQMEGMQMEAEGQKDPNTGRAEIGTLSRMSFGS